MTKSSSKKKIGSTLQFNEATYANGRMSDYTKIKWDFDNKARSVANKLVKEIIPISISTGYVQLMSTNAES